MHKRTSVIPSRARWLMPLAALFSVASLGCPGQELAPLGPCTVSAVSERVDQAGVSDVDLLFMIDNSGSMASEQLKIAKELPRLVQVLVSGDRCAGGNEDNCELTDQTEPKRRFTAVKRLHLGVVSSNMGGMDNPAGTQAAIKSCQGLGDDGVLLHSTEVAETGVIAGRQEFQDYEQGEVVLEPQPDCALGEQPDYQEFDVANMDDPQEVADKFRCVASLGVRGCPFEQQLEAVWKALAPSEGDGPNYEFLGGNGHGEDTDFLRADAILAIIQVTDEEDCSITTDGKVLFEQGDAADEKYGEINMRCGTYAEDTSYIHPTSRYIEGLTSLKADNPDRIIYAAIVGIPKDAFGKTPEEILELPDMQFAEDPLNPGFPRTSCTGMTNGKIDRAYPPRRLVEVAGGFQEAVVYSICEDDYAPALDTLIGKIASKLKGNCLPRRLTPDAKGQVNCEVYELLNKSDTKCAPERGHTGSVIERPIRENGKIVKKKACKMSQVPVEDNAPLASGRGWYYDNFSKSLTEECAVGDQQRIAFKFANDETDLPSGAGATFECFQPVARIDNNARGFDAVNTSCRDDASACEDRSDKTDDGYKLICINNSTCQITCKANPDCPPGWVCAASGTGDNKTAQYCQLPTCPQDNSAPASSSSEE
jgi:hypothetical protein